MWRIGHRRNGQAVDNRSIAHARKQTLGLANIPASQYHVSDVGRFRDLRPGHALADIAHVATPDIRAMRTKPSKASTAYAVGSHRYDGNGVNNDTISISRYSTPRHCARTRQTLPLTLTIEGR
jgi:hypothetical protein